MSTEIEARPYGPDASDEERQAIADRVTIIEEGIVRLQQVPVTSPFTVDILFDRLAELTADWDRFSLLLDLHATHRPSAETRARIRTRFTSLESKIVQTAVFFEANILMRLAVRFLLATAAFKVSLHKTEQEALNALRDVR